MTIVTKLERIRKEAGLTQAELAVRAGTSQPAVNRYERGEVTPSVQTLERLLDACGCQLGIERAEGPLAGLVRRERRRIIELARARGAYNVRVFGSVARGDETSSSDVDLLVDLEPGRTLIDLSGLRLDLRQFLRCNVDVATDDLLKATVRNRALAEARPL